MTLSEFRSRVARVSGMSSSDSGDLTLIDGWVNDAVVQFLKEAKTDVRRASLSMTAESADYALDTDILSLESAWVEPASGGMNRMLERASAGDITQMRLFETSPDLGPFYYALKGAHLLMIHPAPSSSSDELHILYVPRPANSLTATDDDPSGDTYGNIPTEFHTTLESYAKWKACEAEDHKPSDYGLKFQAEWEQGIAKAKASMARKSGVMQSPIKPGRRSRRTIRMFGPGVDTGD